jgi:hypothetical protein
MRLLTSRLLQTFRRWVPMVCGESNSRAATPGFASPAGVMRLQLTDDREAAALHHCPLRSPAPSLYLHSSVNRSHEGEELPVSEDRRAMAIAVGSCSDSGVGWT